MLGRRADCQRSLSRVVKRLYVSVAYASEKMKRDLCRLSSQNGRLPRAMFVIARDEGEQNTPRLALASRDGVKDKGIHGGLCSRVA